MNDDDEITLVVHLVRDGRTVCGMVGLPSEWPAGHKGSPNEGECSCLTCKARLRAARARNGQAP
jgi:hypothetical protein